MSGFWWVILGGALLTYATRVAGYLAVARFQTLPPKVEAALDAVPAAVLVTIAVPGFVDGTWSERLVLLAAGILAFRLPNLIVIFGATAIVAALRSFNL